MARPQVQAHLNNAMGMLSPSKGEQQQLAYFLRVGKEILDTAEGISQFYDRDTPQPLASQGMIEMQRFLNDKAPLSIVLKQLNHITEETFDAFPIVKKVETRELIQVPED